MSRRTRLIILGLSLIVLISIGRIVSESFHFIIKDFWFTSGVLLLILLSLIDQPHFSKDSNIFINGVTAFISLLLVENEFRNVIFWTFLTISLYLIISSYVIMWITGKSVLYENKFIKFFSRINREIGRPQTLFSLFFLWGAINEYGVNSGGFSALMIYWAVFMIINIPTIALHIDKLFEKQEISYQRNALGKIFGVQSKNIFLIKLFPERKVTSKIFDFVEFVYSVDEKHLIRRGLLLDTYLLNEQQWIKVLSTNEINQIFENHNNLNQHISDIVYKVENVPENDTLKRLIGIVTENSTIQKIKFVYNSKNIIKEGYLFEVNIGGTAVYYQIIDGVTKIEHLENKNETSFIVGEAVQLGVWDSEKSKFDIYGWVPEINSPLYLASSIKEDRLEEQELKIGQIPNTNFPVIINKELALTHHTAIVGVTGTGKSIFSRNLIREFMKDENIKVICIDFTGEYKNKFVDLKPVDIVDTSKMQGIYDDIEWICNELEKFGNQQNKAELANREKRIKTLLSESLTTFVQNEQSRLSIIELPEVSNTAGILEYTRYLFKELFNLAKNKINHNKRICVVLEEAHTIVPEWNFVGISEKSAQPLLNSIAQIALQGRKHNVGLVVIAQRTANVSKTILTQCNTIISFQQFDKTSSEFLSNYFGEGIAKIIPTLKFRQAIIAGKALKSNIPMVFEVPEIYEETNENAYK
ncbi:MAG: DUF87 domain-containing protein [Candidatus Cloacimonetes bacterium]|nr:DUF87 domain-containing protein [Candidatus Cloacimonadota bacterium]